MRKLFSLFLCALLVMGCIQLACAEDALTDGVYAARFDTDSSMFHVNETCEGTGILTVRNGAMSIHVTLNSKSIVNLYSGMAADAEQDEENWLQPTVDPVTYPDGFQETVFGFDIPVPELGTEFDCALLGKKGKWYDHKVSVSEPERVADFVEVTLSGGSGRAAVESPCMVERDENGQYWATIVWSSKNYDLMVVNDLPYNPLPGDGNSSFRIPVELDVDMAVSAETVAMSTPHMIDYTLHFDGSTVTFK